MSLKERAEELEGEAATWQLLWFLHGPPRPDFPAGSGGGFVEGAGFAKTARQRASDLLFADAALNRCVAARGAAGRRGRQGVSGVTAVQALPEDTQQRLAAGRRGPQALHDPLLPL